MVIRNIVPRAKIVYTRAMMEKEMTRKEKREARRRQKLQAREENQKRAKNQRVALWGGAIGILVLAVAAIAGTAFTGKKNVGSMSASLVDAVTAEDHVKGEGAAPATLVEYSDFQCPACQSFWPIIRDLSNEFGNSLRVVYRHFLLPQHGRAPLAAAAAEAAGRQEKFWEMHDLIFENQKTWSADNSKPTEDFFADYAEALGLDMEKFKADLNSETVRLKIQRDRAGGLKLGINSTPTFFLNGKMIRNPASLDDFRDIVGRELNGSKKGEGAAPAVEAFDASGTPIKVEIVTSSPVIAP